MLMGKDLAKAIRDAIEKKRQLPGSERYGPTSLGRALGITQPSASELLKTGRGGCWSRCGSSRALCGTRCTVASSQRRSACAWSASNRKCLTRWRLRRFPGNTRMPADDGPRLLSTAPRRLTIHQTRGHPATGCRGNSSRLGAVLKTFALSCALSVALCACAIQQPMVWRHKSGRVDQRQLHLDQLACEGAVASARIPRPSGPPAYGGMAAGLQAGAHDAQRSTDRNAVLQGCMADRGWWLASN
jgi:hypothetical protein